jgi:hypothetical protein
MALIQKAFSDIITFSRSSNATRVGPTGLVEYAPHNLLTYSEQFDNAAWTLADTSITANSASAPNGTVTADTFTASSAGYKSIYRTETVVSGAVYTVSIYAKAKTTSLVSIEFRGSGSAPDAVFNLSTGVVASGTGVITSVGNGWYRCSVTKTSVDTSEIVIIGFNGSSSNTGDSIYIWGAQLSVGPYPLDYTPTTSAAVYGPRFDYDGSGVTIVEPVSTNLILQSQTLDNASWSKTAASITANALAAPDGSVTADKLVEDNTNAAHLVGSNAPSVTNGVAYTISVYAKAGERSVLQIVPSAAGFPVAFANFDLSTGVMGSLSGVTSYAITSAGNGWYRCSVTLSATTTTTSGFVLVVQNSTTAARVGSYTGDGTSGIYLWGAQLEVGSTATSYMVSGATNGFRAVPVVSGSATPKGLLIEESRTNLLTYSEDFSNAAWDKVDSTISSNSVASPDGTVSADTLTQSATGVSRVRQLQTLTSSTAYTLSCFAKAGTSNYIALAYSEANWECYVKVNLATGAIVEAGNFFGRSTYLSSSITALANGWYRITVSFNAAAGASTDYVHLIVTDSSSWSSGTTPSNTSSAGSIYLWGAQCE